ncbi:protein Ifh1p [Monosporozyma servazzii]
MVSQKSPRKNVMSPSSTTPIKSPTSLKKIGGKTVVQSSRKYPVSSNIPSLQNNNKITQPRPRRFSLLYSSEESSLSDVDTTEQINDSKIDLKTKSTQNNNNNKLLKGKTMSNNSIGKKSKLIQRPKNLINNLQNSQKKPQNDTANDPESSDYAIMDSSSDSMESSDNGSDVDSDSDSGSDSGSDTSSDDENIDFVKLTAQRKKRAMKALNAMKRGKTPAKSNDNTKPDDEIASTKSPQKNVSGKNVPGATHFKSNNMTAYHSSEEENEDDDENSENKHTDEEEEEEEEEDIGEEVPEDKHNKPNKDSNELTLINNQVGEIHVPQFTESEESDYDIDQDAYFNVLMDNNDDDTAGEIDTGLETAEDDLPILHQEEQQIVADLQNDDSLSFDGSIHEDGMDPVDLEKPIMSPDQHQSNYHNNDLDDEEEDEIMSDFDMPFYEDPKFSSLHYYADNTEPKLSLSTDLPLILNERKESKSQRREAKKRELKERLKSRKLLREKVKKTANVAGDEYIFGVFFHSDDDDDDNNNHHNNHNHDNNKIEHLDGETKNLDGTLNKELNMDKSLKKLSTSALIDSSDDEYDNILMDIAHIPTDDEDEIHSASNMDNDNHYKSKHPDGSSSFDMSSDEISDEEDDASSVTNVFIDIDDLDPDSFYFHYDDVSSSDGDNNHNDGQDRDDATEPVVYADDESTDEDDNLPPPSARSKINYTKPKEIVSANVVGLKPPKLGTWETDNKPFSIIDGLSTKSLYSLIQEHQQLHDQNQRGQTPDYNTNEDNNSAGEELTLNELLNMSELEDEEGDNNNSYQSSLIAEWYNKPNIPLSAFRNKGISINDDSEYMLPNFSTKKVPIGYVGVEKTRRKIDKMKELQKKRNEKKRKLKKKRKILKLRRERARMEKEKAVLGDVSHTDTKTPDALTNISEPTPTALEDFNIVDTPDITLSDGNLDSRKNSIKSVGIDEIHQILSKDDSNLLDNHNVILDYPDVIDGDDNAIIDGTDADILASLTAPVNFEDFNNKTLWKQRRHSMVEAAAENMRFTKSGLFSESALADIEGIIGANGNAPSIFEFNEVLQ